MSAQAGPARSASTPSPAVVIFMGVTGCGKSTIGALLAARVRWEFEDADWLHPAASVEKMHSGIPLTDEDRWPGWTRSLLGLTVAAIPADTASSHVQP